MQNLSRKVGEDSAWDSLAGVRSEEGGRHGAMNFGRKDCPCRGVRQSPGMGSKEPKQLLVSREDMQSRPLPGEGWRIGIELRY